MRIALLCHYFAPEPGAPQARLLEMARTFLSRGHEVTVLTGFPNHPDGVLMPSDRGRLFRTEQIDGIEVLRSWLYATPNRGILRKTLGHLSFMASSLLVGAARARRPDILVVSSPTFFSVLAAWGAAIRWRIPFVFEVRDLWPAIFKELGILTNRHAIGILESLEMFLYRRAARVVTVTDGFRGDIISRGIPAAKVHTVTNGVDTRTFRPGSDRDSRKLALGLGGKFVVLYLGAHGISHGLGRILDVAERFRNQEAHFLFVGSGAEKATLVRKAAEMGLANVEFRDPVPKREVLDYYAAADLALVPLRDVPLFRTFIPSKLFELLACELPVVGSVAGEAAEILTSSGGALVTPPEDVDAIEAAVRLLRGDPGLRRRMGRAGRSYVRKFYDRELLADRYLALLSDVVRERGAPA